MKKFVFPALAAAGVFVTPNVAAAQSVEPFIGLSAGYHDLDLSGNDLVGDEQGEVTTNEDDGVIYGFVAGLDFPIGDSFFIGAEGNYHFGSDAIDSEYGVAARLGVRVGESSKVYVRGGYQEVELDLDSILSTEVLDAVENLDDTDGDYIVGAGADIGLGFANSALRIGVDTIAFDTVRATAGFVLNF